MCAIGSIITMPADINPIFSRRLPTAAQWYSTFTYLVKYARIYYLMSALRRPTPLRRTDVGERL